MFSRFATRCAAFAGSPRTFAVTCILIVLWAVPAFFTGFTRWNSGLGLFGNNFESTAELLMGLAIQYVVNKSERAQQDTFKRIEDLERRILETLDAKEPTK
jgi:low affinity Fe/Cu permease